MRIRPIVMLTLAAVFTTSASSREASSQEVYGAGSHTCPGGPSSYVGRVVGDVHVTSPFDFIQAVKTLEDRAKESLQLKKGDSFDANLYSDVTAALTTYIRARLPSSLLSFRLIAVHATLEPNVGGPSDCSTGPLVVHYYVFTAAIPRTSANLSEIAQGLTEEPSAVAGALSTSGLLKILPNVNYNHTRRVFAGLTMNQAVPFKVFDHIEADPAVSPNSTTGTVELSGRANPAMKYLDSANWQLGMQYYDVPVGSTSLTKGLLSAAAFASTKELASTVTLRWGAEIGGGHVQDGTGDSANSSYGEIKLLTGIAAHRGNITGSATYGLEVAKPISISTGTFEKHVFDGRFAWLYSPLPNYVTSHGKSSDDRLTYIGTPHHPLSIEGQINGGVITGSTAVPSVERFLGGNQERLFVPGQPWDALSQPFIRSISENRLGTATGSDVLGGTRFYSGNLTIGKAILSKTLVPAALANKDFLDHLDGGIGTAKGELSDEYYNKDSKMAGMTDAVKTLSDMLTSLKKNLPSALMNLPSVKPIRSDLNGFLIGSIAAVASIKNGHTSDMPRLINTNLPGLEGALDRLIAAAKTAGDATSATDLQERRSALDEELKTLTKIWDGLNPDDVRRRADARADKDFAPAETVLNRILYSVNSYSVSPVVIFDVARVWPEQYGTRVAPGAGLRLSVVNANFTLGYAFNPTQANHEGPGALFFKLTFTDLFR